VTPRLGELRLYRNPLRTLASAAPWVATLYLLSYLVVGTALFVVAASVVVTAYALAILTVGMPLLIGAAIVVRGCAEVERHRTSMFGEPVHADYLPATEHGLLAQIKARWTDPVVLRDCAYLLLMFLPLVLLDLLALVLWLACVAGVTLPLWYWLSLPTWHDGQYDVGVKLGYFPSGPDGGDGVGIFVGDLPTALLVAAGFLVLAVLGATVLVATARVHAKTARLLLAPYRDPLADAKELLDGPGPLGDWRSASQVNSS
jgi:hypothetical protein